MSHLSHARRIDHYHTRPESCHAGEVGDVERQQVRHRVDVAAVNPWVLLVELVGQGEHASDKLNPSGDLRASPEYKKHLARVLTKRAIEQAK